jgi:hypothetical protein
MQHYSCDFMPISTLHIRVEQALIRDEVLLVVNGQCGTGGRDVGNIGIKRRLWHRKRPCNKGLIHQLCSGSLAY